MNERRSAQAGFPADSQLGSPPVVSNTRPVKLNRDKPPEPDLPAPEAATRTHYASVPKGPLFRARMKYYAWQGIAKSGLGLLYFVVISDGLRYAMQPLTTKLSKIPFPGFSSLEDFEATHQLDLAHIFALFLLVATFSLWAKLLRVMLGDDSRDANRWPRPIVYRRVIASVASIVIVSDTVLFYFAMTEAGWGSEGFSFTAVIATAAYLTVLIFTTFVSVSLHKAITDLERGISS